MIFGDKILRTRKTSTAVLFLYVLLYLCIAFHFHPVNFEIYAEHDFKATTEATQVNSVSLHCELCHISNNFYQIVYHAFDESDIILPKIDFSVKLISHLTKLSEITHDLRAPPIV